MSYSSQGALFFPVDDNAVNLTKFLPVGTYIVHQNPESKAFYLEKISDFNIAKKLYGTISIDAVRVINTYKNRDRSTGVLLAGEKGSGKTEMARKISHIAANELSIPTIVINSAFSGDKFAKFLQDVGRAVVLFDEFEKTYMKSKNEPHYQNDGTVESQASLLTLLDGTFGANLLFVLTCNDSDKIDDHFINRPGRIFYFKEFGGVGEDFIREYCSDVLKNQEHTSGVVSIANLFAAFNFDMLKALVEEMNRYGEDAKKASQMLNMRPMRERKSYDVEIYHKNGSKLEDAFVQGEFISEHQHPLHLPHHVVVMTQRNNIDEYGELINNKEISFRHTFCPKIQFVRVEKTSRALVFVDPKLPQIEMHATPKSQNAIDAF